MYYNTDYFNTAGKDNMSQEINNEFSQWFKDQNVEIRLSPEETKRKFTSLNALISFIEKEVTFWHDIDSDIEDRFLNVKNQITYAIQIQNNILESRQEINRAILTLSNSGIDPIANS